MQLKVTEHEIQNQIIEYLKIKKWFVYRINSGMLPMFGAGGKQRMIKLGEAGMPDLILFDRVSINDNYVDGIVKLIFIEVKVPGNKPTALQTAKMQELEEKGAKCLVIHSLEELQA